MQTKLPEVYRYWQGKKVQVIDLTQDIPKLKEYIQTYIDGLDETIKTGEPTYNFNFCHEQLKAFAEFHPNFETAILCEAELISYLSGIYSQVLRSKTPINKNRYDY